MPRVYERRFNWDEARELYATGEWTLAALGRKYGVTAKAIRFAVDDEHRLAFRDYQYEWQRNGVCVNCGAQVTRTRVTDERRCWECSAKARAVTVRPDTLRCTTCHEWKPDDAFPRYRNIARRGRHQECTACGTKARQAYRERHKLPCVDCGAPALPPSEKRNGRGAPFPRCRSCYQASRKAVAV